MRKSRAILALLAIAALAPAAVAEADNPFMPPAPSRLLDETMVRDIVQEMLVDHGWRGADGSVHRAGPDAETMGDVPADEGPDRTIGAKLIACVGDKGLWRENATSGVPTVVTQGSVPAVSIENQDVKFGVTFYATPRPPLRNPCAD